MRGGQIQTQEASWLTSRTTGGMSRWAYAVRRNYARNGLGRSFGHKNGRPRAKNRIVTGMSLVVRPVTLLENRLFPTDTRLGIGVSFFLEILRNADPRQTPYTKIKA